MISRIRLEVAAKMVSRAARVARGGSYGTRNTYPVCGRISRTSLDGDSDAWRQQLRLLAIQPSTPRTFPTADGRSLLSSCLPRRALFLPLACHYRESYDLEDARSIVATMSRRNHSMSSFFFHIKVRILRIVLELLSL